MIESLSVPTFRVGYPVMTALDALYVKLDLYLLSEKWKELVEKARSKQL
ncbi:putative dihydrolipoyllysine-residue acetyltransferase [Helianthus anomalus]